VSGPTHDVRLPDLEVAAELAREGASPFGRRLTARALLERFGGEDPATRRRASAALELAGVVAVPPLEDAELDSFVALRRAAIAPVPVALDRRVRLGAAGLLAIVVLVVVAVLLRHVAGGTGEKAIALPASAPATATSTAAAGAATRTSSTAATTGAATAGAGATTGAKPAATAATATVLLRIVPTTPAHLCVVDGTGRTIFNGTLSTPLTVRRSALRFRIGAQSARITANGRPIPVGNADAGFAVTPKGVTPLASNVRVCA
jgi:hypothetical protein